MWEPCEPSEYHLIRNWTNTKDICVNCGLITEKEPQKQFCRSLVQWKSSTEEEKNNLNIQYCLEKYRYKNFFKSQNQNQNHMVLEHKTNVFRPKRPDGIKYDLTLNDFLEFHTKNIGTKNKNKINLILKEFVSLRREAFL